MLKLLSLFLVFAILYGVSGHSFGGDYLDKLQSVYIVNLPFKNKILSDADLQSALMPQELNPAIVFDKDAPWRAVFPLGRQRRDVEIADSSLPTPVATVPQTLKLYSRVATCVALAFGAVVEIILYIIEFYTVV